MPRISLRALLLCFALCRACPARADALAEGYIAYQRGDYAVALRSFTTAAGSGNVKAMNYLGEMYATGKGAAKDYAKAADWFRSGAQKGDPDAQNNLAELYANGWGVALDHREAMGWFRKASDGGSFLGSYNLGKILVAGVGVAHDPSQAAEFLRKAIQANPQDPRFRNWLGSVYFDLGSFQDADEQFRAAAANAGGPAQAWNYYWGMSLLKLDRVDEAAQALVRCRDEDPSHNRGLDRRAEAAALLARLQTYQEHYRTAMEALSLREYPKAKAEFEASLAIVDTNQARERIAVSDAAISGSRRNAGVLALAVVLTLSLSAFGASRLKRRKIPAGVTTLPDLSGHALAGRYQLQGLIGEGGMGQVYLAYDQQRQCKVAAKRMRPELRLWPKPRERFLKEARAISKLKHPNIVGLQEIVDEDGEAVLILDFIEGAPLSEMIARKSRLSLTESQGIMSQVCAAIEHSHGEGIVHRDLKPSNIMIDGNGKALVMDFGLAREMKDTLSRMTRTEIAGTLVYMAPEQHLGKVCRQSDVYALGVSLYEMLTGTHPFLGPDFLVQKQWRRYRNAGELAPGLPEDVDSLLAEALEPEPERRTKTADEFARRLMGIQG